MNADLLLSVAKGFAPALVAGVVACVMMVLMRKGKPLVDLSGLWIGAIGLGVGCALGAAWSSVKGAFTASRAMPSD